MSRRCSPGPSASDSDDRPWGQPPVVDGAVEALQVPLEQRALRILSDTERLAQQIFEHHRLGGQFQPAEMLQSAVDDRIGTDIEQLQVDVAELTSQFEKTRGMAQRDVQYLMRHQPRLA